MGGCARRAGASGRAACAALVLSACGARSDLYDNWLGRDGGDLDAALADASALDADNDASAPDAALDAGIDASADAPRADACTIACTPGDVAPPRAIAPLSTATATSQRPTLRWSLPAGADGARVEICADRACTMHIATFAARGASGRPAAPIAKGVYFWRLFGTAGPVVGTTPSPTWELVIGARSAPVDTSWGSVLDVNGDGFADVAVGTPDAAGPNGANLYGSVQVHLGGPSGPAAMPSARLTPPQTNAPFPQLGMSVASAGDVNGDGYADLVAGAVGGGYVTGTAYVYLGGPNGFPAAPSAALSGTLAAGYFGWSVSGAGDVNGDGYADVVVGDAGGSGTVSLYFGGPSGLASAPSILQAPRATRVAAAGDLNGDGYADVVAGARDVGGATGAIYVYLGGPNGPSPSPVTITGPVAYGFFGYSVACAGDIDGDGYADLIIGSPGQVPVAYLYYGGAHSLSSRYVVLPSQGGPADSLTEPFSQEFGGWVSGAGDVNGDGFADALVDTAGLGTAYLYTGSAGGLSPAATALRPIVPTGGFGGSVSGGGDVNGDGFGDVVVSGPVAGPARRAFVYLGGAAFSPGMPIALIEPSEALSVAMGF